jgi:hypothetical protein
VSGEGIQNVLRLAADEIGARRAEERAEEAEQNEGWQP